MLYDIKIIDALDIDSIKNQLYDYEINKDYIDKNNIIETTIECGIFSITLYLVAADCKPNFYLSKITDYESVELTISIPTYNKDSIIIDYIVPLKHPLLKKFKWTSLFDKDYFNASYVPIDILCLIIKDCYKVSELKLFV